MEIIFYLNSKLLYIISIFIFIAAGFMLYQIRSKKLIFADSEILFMPLFLFLLMDVLAGKIEGDLIGKSLFALSICFAYILIGMFISFKYGYLKYGQKNNKKSIHEDSG